MALQTSGQISINDLRTEFGDTPGDDGLNEYYRGGAYVPDISQNSNVPTSGQIALSDFYGASNAPPIPYTVYHRNSLSQQAVLGTYTRSAGIAVASIQYIINCRYVAGYVFLRIREYNTAPTSTRYLPSGSAQTLTNSFVVLSGHSGLGTGGVQVQLDWFTASSGSGTISVTGTTIDATYSASNRVYRSLSNGQSIGAIMTATNLAECYATRSGNHVCYMTARVRATNFLDTAVSPPFMIEARPTAISTACF